MSEGAATRAGNDPRAIAPGALIASKYRVLSTLAKGGMGHVYIAEQLPLGRPVALKVLHPHVAESPEPEKSGAFRRRFLLEASILSRLQSRHVVTLYDYGTIDGTPDSPCFMAMELLRGDTLQTHLRVRGPLALREAIGIFRQIAKGLRESHKNAIVHRDLKPANVILVEDLDGETVAKICDFGIGAVVHEGDEEDLINAEKGFFGSPKYVAPEQARHEPVAPTTDIYSFGVMLYEAITGFAPFDAESMGRLLAAHCQSQVPPMRDRNATVDVPDVIDAFVLRCLAKSPSERPQSTDEVIRELNACEIALFGSITSTNASSTYGPDSSRDIPMSGPHSIRLRVHSDRMSEPPDEAVASAHGSTTMAELAPRHRTALMLMAVGVLAMLIAAALVLTRRGSPAEPAPKATVQAFDLTIVSTPEGATVFEGDDALGNTPLVVRIDAAHASLRHFVVRLPGHKPYAFSQGETDGPMHRHVNLVAAP